ncbi:hypothetical protein [Nitrosopumilus sp.]|uniref:hypothetical protein n=1 Tax=Nitrosopumilus sp. TaxID=2024843 RepID=UPI0034A06F33
MGIISDIGDGLGLGLKYGLLGIVILVLIFGVIIPLFQNNVIQDNAENIKDVVIEQAPNILKAGVDYCEAKDIGINQILISGIHDQMLLNAKGKAKEILDKWTITQTVTACEVVILDDVLQKDGTEKIWRNQIGLTQAMKNIQGCTLIACIDEYKIIEYLKQ